MKSQGFLNLTSLVQPGLDKCLLWNGWKVMEKSYFLRGKLPLASDGVLLKCSHQDLAQRRCKLYAKELPSRGEIQSGCLYPVTDRCSLCPAGCEDPQFADSWDRSCYSTCCDYCASDGNVTKLEEPDQNLPATRELWASGSMQHRRNSSGGSVQLMEDKGRGSREPLFQWLP